MQSGATSANTAPVEARPIQKFKLKKAQTEQRATPFAEFVPEPRTTNDEAQNKFKSMADTARGKGRDRRSYLLGILRSPDHYPGSS